MTESHVFHRDLSSAPTTITSASANFLHTSSGTNATTTSSPLLDACCGAAVSILGSPPPPSVLAATAAQLESLPYIYTGHHLTNDSAEKLSDLLLASNPGDLTHALFLNSGSEAMEAALKLARQYHYENGEASSRTVWVSRKQSYHGNTWGALAVSGHSARRAPYEAMLYKDVEWLEPCYTYRGMTEGEDEESYGRRLVEEAREVLGRVERESGGKKKVAAVVLETVSGMSLGAVGPVKGYLEGIKAVCEEYGVLLVLDEVMCGMGKLGTHLHAWQHEEGFTGPHIQTIAKALGAGYTPISAVLAGSKVMSVLKSHSGALANGHTYQAHPVACATALAVQTHIRDSNLLENVRVQGEYLMSLLKKTLGGNEFVGDIRGRGLFVGVEFVKDRKIKEVHAVGEKVSVRVAEWAKDNERLLVLGSGGRSGELGGEFVVLSLAYNVRKEEVEEVVRRLGRAVKGVLGGEVGDV